MRVIAGIYKNRPLEFRKTKQIRPTKQIVKKSFFDTICPIIHDAVFVDLFAGNGFIGIEAVSRGAKKVFFVDRDDTFIKKNVQNLNISSDKFEIYRMDVFNFLNLNVVENADIIYVDAPYSLKIDDLVVFLLKKIKKDAIVCVESNKMVENERVFKIKQFGNSILNYLR
ncbi:RsmD family RNA methyltransferase [Desulfurella sp.]|uniref:RsmD family RNA methyltransferase n=1 Tax=Desulfurella sp. TaxID=1962857 RepID=UPI0025C35A3A|nr:RsmD family RNA methyltransferase [Desulfurella sp.]